MLVVLASLLIMFLIISHAARKGQNENDKILRAYFAREREANLTRNQPLDDLAYVHIPFDYIPRSLLADDDNVADCVRILDSLSEKKIVNFTGYTNTDLKYQYGVGNLTTLMAYDENYTLYARTIYRLAKIYYNNGYVSNARILLEKAVESQTDIKGNYTLLAEIYKTNGETDKIQSLIKQAEKIRSSSKAAIIRVLEEFVREN